MLLSFHSQQFPDPQVQHFILWYPADGGNEQDVYDIGQKIEQVAVVQIPKDGEPASRIIPVKSDEFKVAWEFFSASLRLYNAKEELSKLKSPR